jgi:hypothetical protein
MIAESSYPTGRGGFILLVGSPAGFNEKNWNQAQGKPKVGAFSDIYSVIP